MSGLAVHIAGSGDAFGSGGRFQPCTIIDNSGELAVVDFGSSSLTALHQAAINADHIKSIVVSNFHADHFGAVPYYIIDAHLNRKRLEPLTLAGPPGLEERFRMAMEASFPGSSGMKTRYNLEFLELSDVPTVLPGGLTVHAYEVPHAPGDPHLAFRLKVKERIIAYSGDTEWDDVLLEAARDADLLVAEAYFYQRRVRYHMDYMTLKHNLAAAPPKKVVLVHMSPDMLENLDGIEFEASHDGWKMHL